MDDTSDSPSELLLDRKRFHLGPWLVNPRELSLENTEGTAAPVRLQRKEMQLLLALADQDGEPLDAASLRRAVWADQAISDGVLKNLVWRLRKSLETASDEHQLIETVPGVGYRLAETPIYPAETVGPTPESPLGRRMNPRQRRVGLLAAGLLTGLLTLSLAAYQARTSKLPESVPGTASIPRLVVDLPGRESDIALDPTGRNLLFARRVEGGGTNLHVFDLEDPSQTPKRLTQDRYVQDGGGSWSRDGRRIAFSRRIDDSSFEIHVMPATGGPSRLITQVDSFLHPGLSWHDDESLVMARTIRRGHQGLELLAVADAGIRRLTDPEVPIRDHAPAVSPDGRHIAFVRRPSTAVASIHLLDTQTGQTRALTPDQPGISRLAWMPDGRKILFAGTDGSAWALWEVSTDGSPPKRYPPTAGALDIGEVAVSLNGVVAYEQSQVDADMIRFGGLRRADDGKIEASDESRLRWSDRSDGAPTPHPHRDRLAFLSERAGAVALWLVDGDEVPRRLAVEGISWRSRPVWSPDGQSLALTLRRNEQFDIAVVQIGDEPSAALRVDYVTHTPDVMEYLPSWRADGLALHFARSSSEPEQKLSLWEQELWRHSEPRRLADDVRSYQRLPDGRLAVHRNDGPLWLIDAGEKTVEEALGDPSLAQELPIFLGPRDWGNWKLTETGVFWAHWGAKSVSYYDFATRSTSEAAALEHPIGIASLNVSQDESTLYAAVLVRSDSRLWVLDRGDTTHPSDPSDPSDPKS